MGLDVRRLLERTPRRCVRRAGWRRGTRASSSGLRSGAGGTRGGTRCWSTATSGSGSSSCSPSRRGSTARGSFPCTSATRPMSDARGSPADPYELGREFLRWEFATAVAGAIMEINPFDQPDVQAAKDTTNEVLAAARTHPRRGRRPGRASESERRRLPVRAGVRRSGARERGRTCATDSWRRRVFRSPRVSAPATCTRPDSSTKAGRTPAYSCRSSTTSARSCPIPGKDFGFRRLIAAQAAGDYEALKERGRRVAGIRL